jgi:hypothetical protein
MGVVVVAGPTPLLFRALPTEPVEVGLDVVRPPVDLLRRRKVGHAVSRSVRIRAATSRAALM